MIRESTSARFILASASPRRRELLTALGLSFEVRATEADERVEPGLPAREVALRIAGAKVAVALRDGGAAGACYLAADTIVVLDGRVLGKPVGAGAAREMLTALGGRGHDVYTAVVVSQEGQRRSAVIGTGVVMRPYSEEEIEASIAAGTPFDKAGGYAIQDPLLHPVERFDGCYCNVMGLPLWTVFDMLAELLPAEPLTRPDAAFERCARCPLKRAAG